MDNKNILAVVIVIVLFGAIVLYITSRKDAQVDSIKKNMMILPSTIIKTESTGYRGGSLNIYVKYDWQGKTKEQVFMYPKADCDVIGKIVPIAVDREDDKNIHLLLKPADFLLFNLPFPDSLSWTKTCFEL